MSVRIGRSSPIHITLSISFRMPSLGHEEVVAGGILNSTGDCSRSRQPVRMKNRPRHRGSPATNSRYRTITSAAVEADENSDKYKGGGEGEGERERGHGAYMDADVGRDEDEDE